MNDDSQRDDIDWLKRSSTPHEHRDEVDDLSSSPSSGIRVDVPLQSQADKREAQLTEARELHNQSTRANMRARRAFLYAVLLMTGSLIATSCVVIGIQTARGAATDLMLSAFFVSVVAEVVALAVIVAKYLFPDGGGPHDLPKA